MILRRKSRKTNNILKFGACIMVHNMAPFIGACVRSLRWVDGIFIYDDKSTDNSLKVAIENSLAPIKFERSLRDKLAFETGELERRNYVIKKAFRVLGVDILAIVDADEMLSELLKPQLVKIFNASKNINSVAFSTWHLYDQKNYIHFWETEINGVKLIDPHTRIIKKGRRFSLLFKDGSHPIIKATKKTACLFGPYHFHLKYHQKSRFPNYSISFLPERLKQSDLNPYVKKLPFDLPRDIKAAMSLINWNKMPYYRETPHYKGRREQFDNPKQVLIHPKDLKLK